MQFLRLFMKKIFDIIRLLSWFRLKAIDRGVLFLIRLYQKTLSPDHGPLRHNHPYGYCRFYPSCSEYGYRAVKKYGLLLGALLSTWRVFRCNPFSRGGIDQVPSFNSHKR